MEAIANRVRLAVVERWATWTARVAIASVLIVSGLAKLVLRAPLPTTLGESIWSSYVDAVRDARYWIAGVELCVAALLLVPGCVRVARSAVQVFVAAGSCDLAISMFAFEVPPSCGCLGSVEIHPLARAALLAALLLMSLSVSRRTP